MVDTIKMFAWDPTINPNKVWCFIIHTYALKVIFDYHTKYITTYVNDSFIWIWCNLLNLRLCTSWTHTTRKCGFSHTKSHGLCNVMANITFVLHVPLLDVKYLKTNEMSCVRFTMTNMKSTSLCGMLSY